MPEAPVHSSVLHVDLTLLPSAPLSLTSLSVDFFLAQCGKFNEASFAGRRIPITAQGSLTTQGEEGEGEGEGEGLPSLPGNPTTLVELEGCDVAPGTQAVISIDLSSFSLDMDGQTVSQWDPLTMPDTAGDLALAELTLRLEVELVTSVRAVPQSVGENIAFKHLDAKLAPGEAMYYGPIEVLDADDVAVMEATVVSQGDAVPSYQLKLLGAGCITLSTCSNNEVCTVVGSTPEGLCGFGVDRSAYYVVLSSTEPEEEGLEMEYSLAISLLLNPSAPAELSKDTPVSGDVDILGGQDLYKLANDWAAGDDIVLLLTLGQGALAVESAQLTVTTLDSLDIPAISCPGTASCVATGPGDSCTITLAGCAIASAVRKNVLLGIRSLTSGGIPIESAVPYTIEYSLAEPLAHELELALGTTLDDEQLGPSLDGEQSYRSKLPSNLDEEGGWVRVRLSNINFPDANLMDVQVSRGHVPFNGCNDGGITTCTNSPTCPVAGAGERNNLMYNIIDMGNKDSEYFFTRVIQRGNNAFTYSILIETGEVGSLTAGAETEPPASISIAADERRRYLIKGVPTGSNVQANLTYSADLNTSSIDIRFLRVADGSLTEEDACENLGVGESCLLQLACVDGPVYLEVDNFNTGDIDLDAHLVTDGAGALDITANGGFSKSISLAPDESQLFAMSSSKAHALRVVSQLSEEYPGEVTVRVREGCRLVDSFVCLGYTGISPTECTSFVSRTTDVVKGGYILEVVADSDNRDHVKVKLGVWQGPSATCVTGAELKQMLSHAGTQVGFSSTCSRFISDTSKYAQPSVPVATLDTGAVAAGIQLAEVIQSEDCVQSAMALACRDAFPLCVDDTGVAVSACREECDRLATGCGGSQVCSNLVCSNLDVCDVDNCVVGSNAPSCSGLLAALGDGVPSSVEEGLDGGAIAGIVIGALLGLSCCCAAVFFGVKKYQDSQTYAAPRPTNLQPTRSVPMDLSSNRASAMPPAPAAYDAGSTAYGTVNDPNTVNYGGVNDLLSNGYGQGPPSAGPAGGAPLSGSHTPEYGGMGDVGDGTYEYEEERYGDGPPAQQY